MNYKNKISSLEDMCFTQVAINLCQDNSFKEIALLLEKPTYGIFLIQKTNRDNKSPICVNKCDIFVSDPEKLSICTMLKNNSLWHNDLGYDCYADDAEEVRLWDVAIEEQCQRLIKNVPSLLRQGVYFRMNRIALECLAYSRRMEVLFGVPRYCMMDLLTRKDWTKDGRLNEEKLALRLLRDEQWTVLQRYRIACMYCLHEHIRQFWGRLTKEEKEFTSSMHEIGHFKDTNDLVYLWSSHMRRKQEEPTEGQSNQLWTYAAHKATSYGNHAGLLLCWKKLKGHIPQMMLFDLAMLSLREWQNVSKQQVCPKKILIAGRYHTEEVAVKSLNLPVCYSELLLFFISQMDEKYQLYLFKEAFQFSSTNRIMECFLDWPHNDSFLPTIKRLWGIIPKNLYGLCLYTLVSKYCEKNEKENLCCNYRSLLSMLWKMTPENYKQYVMTGYSQDNLSMQSLTRLSEKDPFLEKDELLFKQLFHDHPQEKKREMIHCEVGERILLRFIQKEKWDFGNWLLEACLSKEEVPDFKREFICSVRGFDFCVEMFEQNCERLVKDVIDWSLSSESDKEQFKCSLISGLDDSSTWKNLLRVQDFDKVDRVVNFLSSSDHKKKLYRCNLAICAGRYLMEEHKTMASKQIDAIVNWCLEDEAEMRVLKNHILEYRKRC